LLANLNGRKAFRAIAFHTSAGEPYVHNVATGTSAGSVPSLYRASSPIAFSHVRGGKLLERILNCLLKI